MKRTFSSRNENKGSVISAVVNPSDRSPPPDSPDKDYRIAIRAYAAGKEIRSVHLPFGSARVPFVYNCNESGYVNGYPYPPIRLPAWPLTPSMLLHTDVQYPNRYIAPADADWSFSVASLFMAEEAWSIFENSSSDTSLLVQHCQLVTNFNSAVGSFNRDALASIYYHLSSVMKRLFGIHYRTLATLDLRELFVFLRKLYTEGGKVALDPVNIRLWPNLGHRVFYTPRASLEPDLPLEEGDSGEDGMTCLDQDDEDEFFKDFDTEAGLDTNVALYEHSGSLTETLSLLRIPMKRDPLPKGADPGLVFDSFLPLAAKAERMKGINPAVAYRATQLPMPKFDVIDPADWIKYAVMRIISREFTRNGHYYITPEMLETNLKVYDERHAKGLFPVAVDRSKVPAALTELIEKKKLVVTRGETIEKECLDLTSTRNNAIHIHLRMAWFQEKDIIEKIQTMVDAPPTEMEESMEIKSKVTLSAEQTRAVKMAVTNKFSMITGPGGSGKSTILETIHMILRAKYGPSSPFLFCSFRNGIVYRLLTTIEKLENPHGTVRAEKIDENSEVAKIMPNQFRTLDSIIHDLIHGPRGSPIMFPTVVVMEESGQSRGAHFKALLDAIDIDKVKHFILIGDANQLDPIGQGAPFMHMLRIHPNNAVKLNRVFRTNEQELRSRQDAILAGDSTGLTRPMSDPADESFKWISMDDRRGRMFVDAMETYGGKLYSTLERLDPLRDSYDKTMGLCPYNDYCWLGSVVMSIFYHGVNTSIADAAKDIVAKKRPACLAVFTPGMRVVFEENRKVEPEKEGIYSRGQVGKVVLIVSMPGADPKFPPPVGVMNIPNLKAEKSTEDIKENGAVYIELLDTKQMVRILCRKAGRGLYSKISNGNFMTANRSQGLEFENVICLCPWGKNCADRKVIYTMATRPTKTLTLIGPKTHLTTMIETLPEAKMTRMTDLYADNI